MKGTIMDSLLRFVSPRHSMRLGLLVTMLCGVMATHISLSAQTAPSASAAPLVERAEIPTGLTPISVHSVGRTKLASDGMYTYQWPGTYFLFAYEGSAVYFKVQGKQDLHIFVDGHNTALTTDGQSSTYRISTPTGGAHVVRIDSVNESSWAPEQLGGFAVPAGGKGIDFPVSKRQMEFIGDSHTVGYGNMSPSRECTADELFARTDTTHSIGADTALHYGANYQINAISGHGVVRNYDGGAGDPVPVAYPFLLLDKKEKYDDPSWNPQVIVIALGTNDFSNPLHPNEPWKSRDELHAAYEKTYVQFVEQVRKRNPKALIVLWSTSYSNGEIASEVQKVLSTLHAAGDKRVDFVQIGDLSMSACHYHPSASDDLLISGKLIQDIDSHPDVWPDGHAPIKAPKQTQTVSKVEVPAGKAPLAITWDDLPAHGELPKGLTRLELTNEIIKALRDEHVPPVYGFVNGSITAWEPQSEAVFRAWTEAGNLLGNHTWSHMNPGDHTTAEYKADIDKNEPLLNHWMENKDWHWFRYPFLAEGKTPEQQKEIRSYLSEKGYKIAAVTLSFPDYNWDAPYVRCLAKNDTAQVAKLEDEYLKAARDAALYSRKLSSTLYGKDIPYVLLLHVGPLDAKLLPRTLAQFREMGFSFVPLDQAESDPFYEADTNPQMPGNSSSLVGEAYKRGSALPPAPTFPDLEKVCR
ncbi:MAG: polysaccharide deacetylase family protein [Acidobacteriaceae bacterium]|nr:polysaccharide deacetylase family protein [Acidobacteriaceae bacterium]